MRREVIILYMKYFDLRAEVQDVVREILEYKWLESEKEGRDIGLQRATSEWISRYYDGWFKFNNQRYLKNGEECRNP